MGTPRETYDAYWDAGGFAPVGYELTGPLLALFQAQVRPDDDALDLGCGDGSHSGPWLSAHARSYVGVDVSRTGVALAREKGLDARVIEDAAALPFDDASFDVVVCIEVLEHLLDPLGAAQAARRVLRPGGRFVVTVPNLAHWRMRADAVAGRWNPGGDDRSVQEPWRDPHIRFFSPATLGAMLTAAGFADVHVGPMQEDSLLGRMPGARRLVRRSTPTPAGRRLAERFPGLLSTRLHAVARIR